MITRRTLESKYVPTPVNYAIARPGGPDAAAESAMVICLPGRGDVAATIVDSYRIQDIVASTGGAFAVVAVDGGSSYWHRRANGENRLAMLLNELLPRLRREHLGNFGAGVGLWGWSMGGYGALRTFVEASGDFDAVATGGAALFTSYAGAAPGAFDSENDFRQNDIFAHLDRLTGPISLACGESDPFIAGNRALAKRLATPPTTDFSTGCHENRFWRRAAVAQARFLAAHLPGPDGDAAG